MKRSISAAFAAALLLVSCTPKQRVVVVHSAAEACDVIDFVAPSGVVKAACLTLDAIDRLLGELVAAQAAGVGIDIVIPHVDGSEDRVTLPPQAVAPLLGKVGAARARAPRR